MKFDTDDHKIGMVKDYTRWSKIDNYQDNLKPRSGVFLFANRGHDVRYVGKAAKRGMLDAIRSAINSDKDYQATRIKALYTYDDENALDLRRRLITAYSPLNNERGV